MLITIVFGPLGLVTTLVGMVALVAAPLVGVLVLFGSLAPWFFVFVAWRMVGADPVTLERPKDVGGRRRREARSGGRPGMTARPVEGLAVGAVDAATAQGWRTIVASLAFGKPVAQAVRVVFRVEPGSRAALARLVVPVLRGLQDAGVFPPSGGSEVLIAEKATDDASPGVDITLITLAEAVSTSPPGPGAVTVASAAWPDAEVARVAPSPAETPTGELSDQACFVDVAVGDHRSLHAVIPAGVDAVLAALAVEGGVPGAGRSGEQLTWLRFQRIRGLPVALVGAAGPVAAAAADEPGQHFPTVPLAPRASGGSEVAAAGHNEPGLYRCAELRTTPLAMTPRLASWDAKDAPSQRRLSAYLDHVEEIVGLDQYDPDVPLGLILEVGLGRPLTDRGYDLDNYLYPVASRLGANRFALFRAAKSAAPTSSISVGPAIAADVIGTTWSTATVSTTTSTSSKAWKQQVISQLERQMPEPPASTPVELELAFQVGARRNWANLWKQAIDSLGPILGVPDPARPFAPRDDLIVALGLHRTVNPALANDVRMQVWWRPARR